MRKAKVFMHGLLAGTLIELANGQYKFSYHPDYQGAPVSLTMPLAQQDYEFEKFPAFFEGLLPEGLLLEALLRQYKFDQKDYFGQLIQVGHSNSRRDVE